MNALRRGPVLEVGYNPPDWLQYLAIVRQVPDRGAFLFHNPFTTEPQSGRFVLLYHWLMGAVSAVTGWDPGQVLEASRVVLIFLFFGVLWWFLAPFLETPGERLWAAALVGLGGGLDVWLRPLAGVLPHAFGESLKNATWQAYGWSTFGAMYNPLWIAALVIMLVLLRPILRRSESTAKPRGSAPSARKGALLGLGVALLWWVHPYSAVALVAIGATHWLARSLATRARAELGELAPAAFVFALLVGGVVFWQRMDPVYSAASNEFFGPLALSVFWYPLTYGAVLVFAVVGFASRSRSSRGALIALGSWVAAVAVLHSSPIWNGYHYVMYQHLPLSILAATGVVTLTRKLGAGLPRAAGIVTLLVLSFGTPVLATIEAVQAVRARGRIAPETFDLLEHLSRQGAGNVLAPAELGNMIPAYSHHKVFVGHWFLTPDYEERSRLYDRLVGAPEAVGELALLVGEQEIDYLIVRSEDVSSELALGLGVRERKGFGPFEVLALAARGERRDDPSAR